MHRQIECRLEVLARRHRRRRRVDAFSGHIVRRQLTPDRIASRLAEGDEIVVADVLGGEQALDHDLVGVGTFQLARLLR